MPDQEGRQLAARAEAALEELDGLEPGPAKKKAEDAVQALVDLYGEGLARIMARLDGPARLALVEDELVVHLLLVHDLHPLTLEERVRKGLDAARPYLHSHGGEVELLGVEDGTVRLRLRGTCDGCPSSATTLRLAIEDAIREAAPEVTRIDAGEQAAPMIPLASLKHRDRGGSEPRWEIVARAEDITGHPVVRRAGSRPVVLVRAGGDTYAYWDGCPACGASMAGARLEDDLLHCPGCGRRYDVRRAGACRDDTTLHLEPLPLLTGDDRRIQVAVGGPA